MNEKIISKLWILDVFAPDLLMILYINPKNHYSQPIWYIILHLFDFYGKLVGRYTIVPWILWVMGGEQGVFWGGASWDHGFASNLDKLSRH